VPSASHMHSNFRDKQFHLCLEQVQALDSCGFTIRNTFIHSGASYLKDASASQRAHSVPPPSRQGIDLLEISWSPDGEWWSPMLSHQEPQRTHAPLATDSRDSLGSPKAESCASTTCSENDDLTACNSLRIDASLWERQLTCNSTSTSKLAEFVMSECQFLRIQEYCVLPETSRKAMRRKSKWMLRFYVHGIPCKKRAKWLQPLSAAVAAVLRRRGCITGVHGCELLATLKDDVEVIHIDFAAARCR